MNCPYAKLWYDGVYGCSLAGHDCAGCPQGLDSEDEDEEEQEEDYLDD